MEEPRRPRTDDACAVGYSETVLECCGRIMMAEKSSLCGGNSTKATAAINGSFTKTQNDKGAPNTTALGTSDTPKGGVKRLDVGKVPCANSGADVDRLVDKRDLVISFSSRREGHAQSRMLHGKMRYPGRPNTHAPIQMLEKVAEETNRASIRTKAEGHSLQEACKIRAWRDELGPLRRCARRRWKGPGRMAVAARSRASHTRTGWTAGAARSLRATFCP